MENPERPRLSDDLQADRVLLQARIGELEAQNNELTETLRIYRNGMNSLELITRRVVDCAANGITIKKAVVTTIEQDKALSLKAHHGESTDGRPEPVKGKR